MAKASARKPRPRQRSYYSGILDQPIEVRPNVPAELGKFFFHEVLLRRGACWFIDIERGPMLRLPDILGDEAQREEQFRSRFLLYEFSRRLKALFDHFGIDPAELASFRSLWLSLAWRHESDVLKCGRRFTDGRLFEKYKVDAAHPAPDMLLAFRLAEAHVPGFRFAHAEPSWAASRLSLVELTHMAIALATVRQHLNEQGERTSKRLIADTLIDPRKRKRVLGRELERPVAEILSRGNARDDQYGNRVSERSVTWIYTLDRELEHAWKAYRNGDATPLQVGYVEVVLPMLLRP